MKNQIHRGKNGVNQHDRRNRQADDAKIGHFSGIGEKPIEVCGERVTGFGHQIGKHEFLKFNPEPFKGWHRCKNGKNYRHKRHQRQKRCITERGGNRTAAHVMVMTGNMG